ncbi:MAG: Mov34/MPN/PAD-1 family protein [Candidatus Bathyarchaeia archaeon]
MEIRIQSGILREMLDIAKKRHPREVVLLLRGRKEEGHLVITEYLFPPFATGDTRSSSFPVHMLPMDLSLIGTSHSHPSGGLKLSIADHHNFFGMITLLIAYPYTAEKVAPFNKKGKRLKLKVIK